MPTTIGCLQGRAGGTLLGMSPLPRVRRFLILAAAVACGPVDGPHGAVGVGGNPAAALRAASSCDDRHLCPPGLSCYVLHFVEGRSERCVDGATLCSQLHCAPGYDCKELSSFPPHMYCAPHIAGP